MLLFSTAGVKFALFKLYMAFEVSVVPLSSSEVLSAVAAAVVLKETLAVHLNVPPELKAC